MRCSRRNPWWLPHCTSAYVQLPSDAGPRQRGADGVLCGAGDTSAHGHSAARSGGRLPGAVAGQDSLCAEGCPRAVPHEGGEQHRTLTYVPCTAAVHNCCCPTAVLSFGVAPKALLRAECILCVYGTCMFDSAAAARCSLLSTALLLLLWKGHANDLYMLLAVQGASQP